jgi:shikimate dehydrogenase
VEKLRPGLVVMDIVYNPLKTRLLREAACAGCTTIDGLSMFVHQGARQFELWTGMKAPVDIMRMAVEAELAAL